MEESGAGYLFIKAHGGDDEAQFIRSTNAPISQIAYHIYNFAKEPFETRTPRGRRTLDITDALFGQTRWETFLYRADDPDFLIESLRVIAMTIPKSLVLIIDQAEEVLTLNPGNSGINNRSRFFAFLRSFQELDINARIIVTLRTEYFGRFADASQSGYEATARFQHFFLADLQSEALLEAIVRPTQKGDDSWYGQPPYGFSFEKKLPNKIVEELINARHSGPALPILQIVCLGLYRDCISSGQMLITYEQYATKGGVEGQLVEHVKSATASLFETSDKFHQAVPEILSFLSYFYILQEDGTVVSRTRSVDWAESYIERLSINVSPEALLSRFTEPEVIVLRRLRHVDTHGVIVSELTLGHDAVALAVEHWKDIETRCRASVAEEKSKETVDEAEKFGTTIDTERKRLVLFIEKVFNTLSLLFWVGMFLSFLASAFAFFALSGGISLFLSNFSAISPDEIAINVLPIGLALVVAVFFVFMVVGALRTMRQIKERIQVFRSVTNLATENFERNVNVKRK